MVVVRSLESADGAGGDRAGTVVPRATDYGAPVCSHFGHNARPDGGARPFEAYGGCTLCDPTKIRYVDEHVLPQLKELVTLYQPAVIFADGGEWDEGESFWHTREFLAWLYNEALGGDFNYGRLEVRWRDPTGDESVLGAISFLAFHESYHVGQIALLHRAVGRGSLSRV